MAVIKKYGEVLDQPLSNYQTFVTDTDPLSQYFRITEFKDTFTGGKNGFLIEGSKHLLESTEIKIQILDVEGKSVYWEPGNGIPEYYEGLSKVIAVYVYEDTPIGIGSITILGELKTYVNTSGNTVDIPAEWQGIYNLKWSKSFQINRLLSNEDKVRFYKRPLVNITEIVKPIFNNVVTTLTQTGSVTGIAQAPRLDQPLAGYSAPTSYLLKINDNTNWTGSVVGTYINIPSLGYTTLADSVINNKELLVKNPYTADGLVDNFTNVGYTASFNYVEGVNNLKTALTGSFAKINLTDLTTFVGDVARVKIYRKSQSDLSDYQFVQEIKLESNELLVDLESYTKNQEYYGIFDNSNYKNYWVTSSNNLTASFNQNYLFDSVKFNGTGINQYHISKSINITENTEYTLDFNSRISTVTSGNYIKAFLSGSRQTSVNGTAKTIQIQQTIVNVDSNNSLLQKLSLTNNFKAEQIDNAKLYFEVVGNDWYISDVSLRASQETSFSPNEITFIQSVPRSLPEETFLYRFEFYDINNNYIPVSVEANKTFNGGNLQRIQKGLVFTPRSLTFQFDSGSNPVPPTVVGFNVTKNLLTGSVHYTSQSYDLDGIELFRDDYTASITLGGGFPGLLDNITSDTPTMTVQHFTGSRSDKTIQLIKITGEVEGFTDSVVFSRVLDGFGGVNYLIRPYRGTQIRNSSTASLEIQAIRIDGINDIELSSLTYPTKGWPDKQLHIISRSSDGAEKFVNLAYASSSKYIYGLTTGSLGSGEINYNATFNRDSIDFRRTVYLISSQSAASGPAYLTSGSILASQILEDLQDGLDSGVFTYNADTFNINPRTQNQFTPIFGFATASFSIRGTQGGNEFVTASFQIYPSMSINKDWVPEYWMYYHTQSMHPTITVSAKDDNKFIIPVQFPNGNVRSPLSQSKNLTVTFTYIEPWTSASVSIDKTFTIVPEGKQGDESIIFEVSPASITMPADSRGFVKDYKTTVTQIKLKQGSKYLAFSSSAGQNKLESHGQFHIAQASIISTNITGGLVYYDNRFTESLIISASSDFTNLSASLQFPLIIHPYYTSSIYTQSVVQNFTKVLDGPPPIQIIISPTTTAIKADEVGYVTPDGYVGANTTLQVKEGDDFLTFTTQSAVPGTWRINLVETLNSVGIRNIRTGSLSSSSLSTATLNFNRFDYPFVSASVNYTIQVYPFALGAGFRYTSSIYNRTQTITKNVSTANARSVNFKASSYTINYNRDGNRIAPLESIDLTVTAFNTTGSYVFGKTTGPQAYLYYIEVDGSETFYDGPQPMEGVPPAYAFTGIGGADAAGPGENKTWKVKITDGKAPAYNLLQASDIRAEGQLTIAGIKAGNDAYKLVASNESTSITANLWTSSFNGTGMKITTFKGTTQLINVHPYPAPDGQSDYDFQNLPIGVLGYSSASIFSKSSWITPASNKFPTSNPASIGDISDWTAPGINTTGEIVYKVDFENNQTYGRTQTQFVTQSFAVQFTDPSPYSVSLTNDNSSAVFKVSGQFTTAGTGTSLRIYRGQIELVNTSSLLGNSKVDAYGVTGYPARCRVSVLSKSSWLTLGSSLVVGSFVPGNPATMPPIAAWSSPETNTVGEIVYQIDCEGRQTLYKTQSLSIQQEGATGPGIVMRGEWSNTTNYSGSVETKNNRRDAVIYGTSPTTYYAAISGSGPATYDKNNVFVAAHAPTAGTDNAWWQYLGQEEFFVAAKIAIFEESFVKNTINVGNNPGSAYANIVLAGGRNDPYMAIGQYATIGYGNQGIWQGIYDLGGGSYMPRLSLVNSDASRFLKWTGTGLEIKGDITVTGGDASTKAYADASSNTARLSAIGTAGTNATTALNIFSGSLGALAAINKIEAGMPITYIGPGAIVTNMVATNLITSTNYSASIEAGVYSDRGTFLDLSNGSIKAPGFSIQSNGNASFKGFLSSSQATFGAWKLDNSTLASINGRITLDAVKESITVLDTANNPRFIANTDATLPSPSANAPSPPSGTGAGFSFDSSSINDKLATPSFFEATLHNLLDFTAATGGGSHLITYNYNPTYPNNSYVYANGSAYATMGITLVVTDSGGANIQYGTNRYFYAYGDFYDACGGGYGSGFYPSVVGDTEITLSDGSLKLAKDIKRGDLILSWDSSENKFTIGELTDIRRRSVDFVYRLVVGGKEIKVSDSHKFWGDGDIEIATVDLVAGVSQIYIKTENGIQLTKVDIVEILYEKDDVFTFSVRQYHNYVSNEIISHNSAPYCYQFSSQISYVSKPMKLTITTSDLTSGGSYKVQLYITKTGVTQDTTPYTAYEDSTAQVKFSEQGGSITLKRISAGTIANGGGFQSVVSDTKFLQVVNGTDGGSPLNIEYSTLIKGNLNLKDGTIISDTTTVPGFGPAVKAFGYITNLTAATQTVNGYGIAGVSRSGVGQYTVTLSTDQGSTGYTILTGFLGENGGTGFDKYHAAKIGVRVISNTAFQVTTIRADNLDRIDGGAFYIAILYK